MSKLTECRAVYKAQGVVINAMPSITCRSRFALLRVLYRLDQRMVELSAGTSPTPLDPGSSLSEIAA